MALVKILVTKCICHLPWQPVWSQLGALNDVTHLPLLSQTIQCYFVHRSPKETMQIIMFTVTPYMIQHGNTQRIPVWKYVRIFLTLWSTSILFLDKNVTSKIICLNIMRVYFASGGFLSDKIIFQKEVLLGQPSTSPELFSVRLVGLDTKIHKNDLSIYPEILQNSHFKWFFFLMT